MTDTTYSEIKTQVQYNLGRGAETNIIAQMNIWARFSVRDIINWRDHWFMEAQVDVPTVVDQQEYDLPNDYKGNLKIMIRKTDRYVELNGPIDMIEAQRRFAPSDEGEPTDWSHSIATDEDETFKVWPPKPDAVYTMQLNYQRYITDLTDSAQTNVLTIKYPQLLIAYMTKYGFMYLQEWGEVEHWNKEITRMLGDIHAHYVARTLGRDFTFTPRADVKGHADQSRGTAAYIIIK